MISPITTRATRRRSRRNRQARAIVRLLAVFAPLFAGALVLGQYLADRIEVPVELPPVHGRRFIPIRDRRLTDLETSFRTGRLHIRMAWRHPDSGETRTSSRVFRTGAGMAKLVRREFGGYAGPVFRSAETRSPTRRIRSRLRNARYYTLDPDVRLALDAERGLSSVADRYHARTGSRLSVTSGTRDAADQARAMHTKLELGDDIVALYGGSPLVHEIKGAYDAGRAAGKRPSAIRADMTAVIRAQIERGDFISSHLRAGAVDLRSRGFSDSRRAALFEAAREVPGVRLLEETTPPHFHMQVNPPQDVPADGP